MEKKCVKETNNVTWTRGRVVTCLQRIALRRTANGRALIDRCRRTHVGLYVDRHTIIRIFISSIRMYPLTSIARLHQTMFVAFASSRGDNSVLRWKIERIYEDLALFLSISLSLSLSSPFISISFALVFFYVLRSFESHADSTKSRCFCVRRLSRVPWGLPMNVNSGKCRLNTEAFVDTGRTYRASWKFMSTTRIAI